MIKLPPSSVFAIASISPAVRHDLEQSAEMERNRADALAFLASVWCMSIADTETRVKQISEATGDNVYMIEARVTQGYVYKD